MKLTEKFLQLQHSGESKKLMEQFAVNIDHLLAGRSTSVSYQLAYDTVYKLTKDHKQTELLTLLEQKLTNFLQQKYLDLDIAKKSASLLNILTEAGSIVTRMTEICLFLDVNYCQKELSQPLKKRLGETIFRSIITEQKALQITAKSVFEAKQGDRQDCIALLNFISNLDEKQQFFERFLLSHYEPLLRKHYQAVAKQKWKQCSLLEYLVWCKGELQSELTFGKTVLVKKKGQEGLDSIQNTLYSIIVLGYKSRIYEADEEQLFERLSLPILELFRFGRNKEVEGHIQWFMTRIEARLNSISTSDNAAFLSAFCSLYHRVAALLKDSQGKFQINYRAVFTFEEWINNEKFNVPLRLNMLLDTHLRTLQQGKSIENAILVFKLVKQKNIFENVYRRMLLSRLVYLYSNYKLEEEMRIVDLMERECGDEWTKKIKSICQLFGKNRDLIEKDLAYGDKLRPVIVEENDWPFEHKQTNISLHPQLIELTPRFEQKYLPNNKNHRLLWSPRAGTVTLSIKFFNSVCTALVPIEAANLLLSLQKSPLPLTSYLCETGYKLDEVETSIQALVNSKLLISTPKGSDFILELARECIASGVIDLVSNADQGEIEVKAMQELKADRKLMVQAIIVKIMKSQKMSKRAELVHKTAPLLALRGFNFNADFVSKSIDRLLDKQFLRDFEDGSLGYIA